MTFLFKDTFDPIRLKLTSGTQISLEPSVCRSEIIVLSYRSVDIDISFNLEANARNYHTLATHIEQGRYSQVVQYAAMAQAAEYHQRVIAQAANLSLIA